MSSRNMRRLFAVALATPLALTAQTPPVARPATPESVPQPSVYRVTSNLVVLDVVATDKAGKVVPDLTKDEFTVYENGVRQTIRTLDSPTERPTIPMVPGHDRNGHPTWGESPITVIVLDQLNTPIEEIAYARDELFKYLAAQPAQLSEPTSLIVLNDAGIQNAIPATRDRDSLLKSARSLHVALPYRLKRSARSELLVESFALLRQIALSTSGDRGRKNVLWVGRGFASLDPQALDPHDQELFLTAVRSTVNLLLASRVTLSKIDPRSNLAVAVDGDPSDPTSPSLGEVDDPFATTFSFGAFIAQTGGKNFMYLNDLAKEIDEGVTQGSNFYTMSYVPTDPHEDGKYRKLDVRVSRPGVVLRSKLGFYAGPQRQQPSDRDLSFDMVQAAASGMQYAGVGVRIVNTKHTAGTNSVHVQLSVDTDTLPFSSTPAGGEQTTLYVSLAALDDKGKLLRFSTVSSEIEIPATQLERIATGHTSVPGSLTLPKNTAAVRVIVRDANGRIGTAEVDPGYFAPPPNR